MDTQNSDIEAMAMNDSLGLDSWNRQRSHEELRTFIMFRHNMLAEEEI